MNRVFQVTAVFAVTALSFLLIFAKMELSNGSSPAKPLPSILETVEPAEERPEIELREVRVSFCRTKVESTWQHGLRFEVTCWVGATSEPVELKVGISFSDELEALFGTDGTAAFSIHTISEERLVTRTLEIVSPSISAPEDIPQPFSFTVNGSCNDQLILAQKMTWDKSQENAKNVI